ncbi:MAG: VanZ family protein, partial [Clostridia bacterium]|nr:VanZ family protein [Clostridia bacterium]
IMEAEEVIRTMGHGLEFCGLAVLLAVLIGTYERIGILSINGYSNWALAVFLSVAYAVTDEVHQIFVPGRVFDWYDIGVDTIGAAIGALLATWICWSIAGHGRKNGLS